MTPIDHYPTMLPPHRLAVSAAVGLVLAVTLLSGPLVGAVDFTQESEAAFAPGEGRADVSVVSLPGEATLTRGKHGAGAYYLEVPDAAVRVANASGQPMLSYKLRIPDLGYTRSSTHVLDDSWRGERALSLERDALDPDRVDRERYAAEVVVRYRGDSGSRVLAEANATVVVRR